MSMGRERRRPRLSRPAALLAMAASATTMLLAEAWIPAASWIGPRAGVRHQVGSSRAVPTRRWAAEGEDGGSTSTDTLASPAAAAADSATSGSSSSSSSSSTSTSSSSTSSNIGAGMGRAGSVAQSFSPFLGGTPRQRPGLLFTEEIDFCLGPNKGAAAAGSSADKAKQQQQQQQQQASRASAAAGGLAGADPEMLRIVNTFANQAAKKILIGVDCCFGDMADAVKQRLRTDFGDNAYVDGACGFIDAVSALSPCSELHVEDTKAALARAYEGPYDRVVDTLLGTNCEFRSLGLKEPKVRPRDRDICLSLYDTITGAPTKTKQLNVLSNRVARTMLYGDEDDVAKLAKELDKGRAAFLEEWVPGGDERADECAYYDSLRAHLTGGLDAPGALPTTLGGGFSNAYQRFMTLLVQELGTRPAPVDGELFDSFVRWESSLRKNLTQDMWDPHPKELTGTWTLYDNANGMGLASAGGGGTSVGAAGGGVSVIGFRKDGTLKLPQGLGMDGSWSFEPGPTHLDTIRFEIRLGTPDARTLVYTGYVDRGQRIETRFSKRAIKMKGRMVLKARGNLVGSNKFQMELERKKKLLGRLATSKETV